MMHTNGTQPETKKDPLTVLDDGDQIARLMAPFYQALAALAFRDASDVPGIDVTFDLANPFVQLVLSGLARDVRQVADTTKTQIAELVGRQAAEGWSNERLGREIRQLGVDMSRQRGLTIARTESAAGYSQGSIAAYESSGVVDQIEWLIGPDPCEICEPLNGRRAELGGEFADGISAPPAHPRCTCAISPVVKGT